MIVGITAVVILGLDRLFKVWALKVLAAMDQAVELWLGVLRLVYAQNTGVAFGLMESFAFLPVVITLVMLAVGYLLLRPYKLGRWPKLCVGAILGGALGNLLDRILYGYVIDMVAFSFVDFAIFNLADAAICVGGVLLAASILFRPKDWRQRGGGKPTDT